MNDKLYSQCLKFTQRSLREGWALQPAYRDLIKLAAEKSREPLWKNAAALDIAADADHAAQWLTECFKKEPPRPNIRSLWFGLFEDVTHGWTLYVSGSTKAADSRSIDWAVNPAWFPRRRYYRSTVLRRLSGWRPRKNYEMALLIETGVIFPTSCLLVAESLRRIDPALLLGKAKTRSVACGFDDGDFMLLGALGPHGLEAKPRM